MEVKKAKQHLNILEKKFLRDLQYFEEKTGLTVIDVNLESIESKSINNEYHMHLESVKIDVSL